LYQKCRTCLLQEEDKKLYSMSPSDSGDECRDDFSDVKIEVKDHYDHQEARLDSVVSCWYANV